ncbi:hypothetical protein BUALT_Bualt07G0147200 [Buddleja alternifolia]|uniref:PGG domain-containing protein n=1 Tax=Buddleja alternifolia TaxID=168488 RepID=A0AAV6XA75_9LAMI|nr:hypothetical protein BUALT_Bualt07G0147200 [Buddleja alternifolia]
MIPSPDIGGELSPDTYIDETPSPQKLLAAGGGKPPAEPHDPEKSPSPDIGDELSPDTYIDETPSPQKLLAAGGGKPPAEPHDPEKGPSSDDQTLNNKQMEQLKRLQNIYREALHNTRDTMALVAILIVTFTFNAGINPPGGVHQDGPLMGTSIAARKTAFKVFSVCNNIALFVSLGVVLVMISIIPFRRKALMKMMSITHKVLWMAVSFMATAYVAAAMVMMPPPRHGRDLDWTTAFLVSISAGSLGFLFICMGIMKIERGSKKREWRKKHPEITDSSDDDDEDGISYRKIRVVTTKVLGVEAIRSVGPPTNTTDPDVN